MEPDTTTDAADQTSADGATSTDTATATDAGTSEVRDPAKLLSAYEAEKGKRREQDAELRRIREEFDAFKAKAEGKEAEHQAALDAQRVQDEALAKANDRILKAELRAAAAGKLSDPADALKFIDLSAFEVGADGEVDSAAVSAAIDNLVTTKPYLAAQGGQRFQGTADGGARNDATQPSQLTRADLDGMSPEAIVKAKADGRLNDLLGIKTT